MNWLLGRYSKLTIHNKLLLYRQYLNWSRRTAFSYGAVQKNQTVWYKHSKIKSQHTDAINFPADLSVFGRYRWFLPAADHLPDDLFGCTVMDPYFIHCHILIKKLFLFRLKHPNSALNHRHDTPVKSTHWCILQFSCKIVNTPYSYICKVLVIYTNSLYGFTALLPIKKLFLIYTSNSVLFIVFKIRKL